MRKAGAFVALVLALVGLSTGALAAYPSPAYDFSHPGSTHVGRPLFSSVGGQSDRAILVIYIRWIDIDYPAAFPASTVAQRYFGTGFPSTTFPSVGDFFRRLSFNDLFVFPASEYEGTAQDGVVQVQYPGTKADFQATPISVRNKTLLELADPYFDYSLYDVDGNGSLDNTEIVVNMLEAEPNLPLGQGCGLNAFTDPVTLDGTVLNSLQLPLVNTATNLITIIHENGHALTQMADLYGFGAGRLDFAGPTCSLSDATLFAPNSWTKMHLGWITPTVVDADGYYNVGEANSTGDALILYDPAHGTDDYFLVENRETTPGTYDQGASDSGLVIWRVSDASLGVANGLRPIEPMLPSGATTTTNNYGGSSMDAWDPSDPATPQREMVRTWADGTASPVSVRAIGPKANTILAYFDVVGPGILVDTYPLDKTGPITAVAGSARVVDVPIMNTAEAGCDTFYFQPVNLPAGWTSTQGARILCADERDVSRMSFTAPAGTPLGTYDIAIKGWSKTDPAVQSVASLRVTVTSASGSIQAVADQVTTMIAGATTTTTQRTALLAARDELIGNINGASESGALDALAAGDEVAAVTKLGSATSYLLTARSRGVDDTVQLEVTGSASESVALAEYAKAQAARPSATKELARITGLIDTGRVQVQNGRYSDAQASFKQAVAKATSLQ
jgi:M6 family metalloprotease-like protein